MTALLAACTPGQTPEEQTRDIFEAAAVGDLEIVQELLAKNPNLVNGSEIVFTRKTPLHVASSPEIAAALLDAGAPVNALDVMGLTALHTAKRPAIVDLLIERGADVDSRGTVGATPLHLAVFPNVAEALIRRGANINAPSETRGTPLYSQTMDNRYPVVRLLLEHKADPNFADPKTGNTPLHAAAELGLTDITQLLIEHGAKIDAKNSAGETPLVAAVKKDRFFSAKKLLALGANPSPAVPEARGSEMKRLLKR
jgi:cytohesin